MSADKQPIMIPLTDPLTRRLTGYELKIQYTLSFKQQPHGLIHEVVLTTITTINSH